jgi:hypothetical protein
LIFGEGQKYGALSGEPVRAVEAEVEIPVKIPEGHTMTAILLVERLRILLPGAAQLSGWGARHADGVAACAETGP